MAEPTIDEALHWIADEYRQCIVAARVTTSSDYHERVNGRAEAYRRATDRITAVLGIAPIDWDGIKRAVPADGIYRSTEARNG